MVALLNDRAFMDREGVSLFTADFVRYDRRHVTPQPPCDAETWVGEQFVLEQLAGEWPTYELAEVVAVRGDRLSVSRGVVHLGDVATMEFIVVAGIDEAGERAQIGYYFDPEDVDRAIVELDRLHAELG